MKKYAQGEGEVEVLRGEEAVIVNEHLSKTGKAVSDFDDNEREALHADLDKVRDSAEPLAEAPVSKDLPFKTEQDIVPNSTE